MAKDYYYTKVGPDDWIVTGRRHHLQVVRTEGSSGREDFRGREVYQTVFLVQDRLRVINLDDQYDQDAHGHKRLRDALKYAVDKLGEYDEKVDPRKKKGNPGHTFAQALKALPEYVSYDPLAHKTVSDLVYQALHELEMFEEGQDGAISAGEAASVRKFVHKFRTTEQ